MSSIETILCFITKHGINAKYFIIRAKKWMFMNDALYLWDAALSTPGNKKKYSFSEITVFKRSLTRDNSFTTRNTTISVSSEILPRVFTRNDQLN